MRIGGVNQVNYAKVLEGEQLATVSGEPEVLYDTEFQPERA